MGEIDHDPIVDNSAVHDFPEIHIADLNSFAGGGDAHEFAAMGGLLPTKGCSPFAHEQPRLIDADLVMERRLKRLLPIVLKFTQPGFGATTLIAHPAEALAKEIANVADAVIVQAVHHAFDHGAGGFSLAHIRGFGQHGLLGS